jgi:PAS domain-containing protein
VTPLLEEEAGCSGSANTNGTAARRLMWAHADVSDRQEQARLLQLRNRALNSMSDGIFVADAAGALMFANQGFARLTGYGQEAAAGQPWTFLLVSGSSAACAPCAS